MAAGAFALGLGRDVEVVSPGPRFGRGTNALLCPQIQPGPLGSSWALCPWISVVTLPAEHCPWVGVLQDPALWPRDTEGPWAACVN